jgi:hypothetical protein
MHTTKVQLQCTVQSNLSQNSETRDSYKKRNVPLDGNTPEIPQHKIP